MTELPKPVAQDATEHIDTPNREDAPLRNRDNLQRDSLQDLLYPDGETSPFFKIQEVPEGFQITLPGAFTDKVVLGTYSKTVPTRAEAEHILLQAKEDINPRIELASLQRSFSSFHSITPEENGGYTVTYPTFHSSKDSDLLAGTGKESFDSWAAAKQRYLELRNQQEYPETAVFHLKVDDLDYKFSHLNNFGQKLRLSDMPLEISDKTKTALAFETRNNPKAEAAPTYAKTLEAPGWQSEVFRFVENFSRTSEGQQLVNNLQIKDLRLLTPQQATRLSLELVTRLKKYNLEELNSSELTDSDQNTAIVLLQRGLQNRDNQDYKGNGVCRNFASAVKAVFEGLKNSQTKFNYLQDTYVFYESGLRADFDPAYEASNMSYDVSLKTRGPVVGHAWNSFVTITESGMTQTVVDATWSDFDYDTQESVKLDYTLQRMEKDVYRNLQRKDAKVEAEQGAKFYLFLLDTLPQQQGLVLDTETVARAKNSNLYQSIDRDIRAKYNDLTLEQYQEFTLKVYKNIIDTQGIKTKTQFYLERAMAGVRGREQTVTESTATELTRLVAETKQDVGYFDVVSVYALPTQRVEDRLTAVSKYVKSWEAAQEKGYVPIRDLVFGNKDIQTAILQSCSPQSKEKLSKELNKK